MPFAVSAMCAALLGTATGCSEPTRYTSTVEVVQVQAFGGGGADQGAPAVLDVEMIFVECPGVQRKVVRGDKAFAACARKLARGDRVPVEIVMSFRGDRGDYRNEVVKLGDCERKVDPRDEASYESVQECTDVVVNGAVTGVHCDRTRGEALLAKCPWFRRK